MQPAKDIPGSPSSLYPLHEPPEIRAPYTLLNFLLMAVPFPQEAVYPLSLIHISQILINFFMVMTSFCEADGSGY